MNLDELLEILICPTCGGKLDLLKKEHGLTCQKCFTRYDLYDDRIPILLNEESKKDIESFYQNRIPIPGHREKKKIKRFFIQAPDIKLNHKRERNLLHCFNLLSGEKPKILTIGNFMPHRNGTNAQEREVRRKYGVALKMDILVRDNVDLVGDGHVLPLVDNYFDLVIAQATIKHLRNPKKFVQEVYRVLRPQGIFYCEVPYLLLYHRWPGDYVRFTPLGLRQLLKDYQIIETAWIRGPSQTVADVLSVYIAMLLSFKSRFMYSLILKSISWILHPIKYFDYLLQTNPWADLLAQVNYCIARKVNETPDSL